MNRNLIIALIVLVVAGGGYYQFVYKPAEVARVAAEQKAAEEKAAAEEAAAAAKKAEEEAAAAAKKAEEEAAAFAAAAAEALDPAKFDAEKLKALIASAQVDDKLKAQMNAAVDAAAANPAGVEAVVNMLKGVLVK